MPKIILNGNLIDNTEPVLYHNNRSFKYGDGFFETLRVEKGNILLENYHQARFTKSIEFLKLKKPPNFSVNEIVKEIRALCDTNECIQSARVRLSIFRGSADFVYANNDCQYLIEAMPLKDAYYCFNKEGLNICIFEEASISCDKFSNLKTANYLPYIMASIFASENKKDEVLLLNIHNRIAESAFSNIFIVKDGIVHTPPLTEGCVDGVMRKFLLNEVGNHNIKIIEKQISREDLIAADEIFLTNAINGIQWVGKYADRQYTNVLSKYIFEKVLVKNVV